MSDAVITCFLRCFTSSLFFNKEHPILFEHFMKVEEDAFFQDANGILAGLISFLSVSYCFVVLFIPRVGSAGLGSSDF